MRMRRFGASAPTGFVLSLAALLLTAASARADLTPDRLYYGVSRPIPMKVSIPAGTTGKVEIALLEPVTAKEMQRAGADAGAVDMAALFPVLWTRKDASVLYAQLLVGGVKQGPAVVLQPMLTPMRAENANLHAALAAAFEQGNRKRFDLLLDPQSQVRASIGWRTVWLPIPQGRLYSGIRAYTDRDVLVDTDKGPMTFALRPDQAPNTCFNFIGLVEGGFYSDIQVHRIRPKNDGGNPFVIQFGDPLGNGTGGPGYTIDLEPTSMLHDFGVLSMARGLEADSGGSQVFICLSREGTKFLDGEYAAFGNVVAGADTIMAMEAVEVGGDNMDRPRVPPVVRGARTIPAKPYGEGAKPVMRPETKAPGQDR